jgi:hypothetical protein
VVSLLKKVVEGLNSTIKAAENCEKILKIQASFSNAFVSLYCKFELPLGSSYSIPHFYQVNTDF